MAIEPLLAKGLTAGAKPLFAKAALQWKRRGASPLTELATGTVDRELEEALDTLTGDAATLPDWLLKRLKAAISARPIVFDDVAVREWLRIPRVRRVIKDAVLASVVQERIDEQRDEAAELYAAATDDADWYGGNLFDYAVAFLSLTLDAKTSTETRIAITAGNRNAANIVESIVEASADNAVLHDRTIAAFERFVDGQNVGPYPAEVVGRHILDEVEVEARWRLIEDPDRVGRLVRLAERVADGGDFHLAPAAARIEAMRLAAAALAREGRVREAAAWLEASVVVGANDLGPDRARIAIIEKDWAVATIHLNGRTDRISISMSVDLVKGRDGEEKALEFTKLHLATADLTGFLLPGVASWMAAAGDWTDAERLLAAATIEQITENPPLLFLRARLLIALLGPPEQRLDSFNEAASLPRPSTVRTDVEGVRLLGIARADLGELAAMLPKERYAAFAIVVDTHRIYLDLLFGGTEAVRSATDRLHAMLADYASVVDYAWLALAFDIEFDETTLRTRLDRARIVGGWTPGELATAFQLLMRDDVQGGPLAAFIDENRQELIDGLGPERAIGTEIEALARQGRIPEGRARLDEWRSRFNPAVTGRLEAILAEQEGGNPLAIRLARFKETYADPELLALLAALSDAKDGRLAEYSAMMWRRRHRREDAVRACDVYANTAQDEALERFLEELGSEVEDEPLLGVHKAWASYRTGDLADADRRLSPLRAASPDDGSLRQLEINIALEGGDWRRLAPLVRQDLDRKEHRSARQLLQAAEIAHASDDPISDDLTRAAVAAAPDDASVLMNAFLQAMRRGKDFEAEASGWLRRATELSDESGPLQQRRLRDVVELRDEHFRKTNELDGLIMSGDVPLVMVAKPLNTTLSELILSRMAANITMTDGRQRLCLPFVAGNRLDFDMTGASRVGFDQNAILVLQLCGLLEEAVKVFPVVVIPAGMLPSMFNDLTRADRTQPSRVEQAVRIKALVDGGRLMVLDSTALGIDSFDGLYAAAERLDGLVVHGSPLYVAGTFMEQVRDADPYLDRLIDPAAIAEALSAIGEVGAEEKEASLPRLAGLGAWSSGPVPNLDRPLVIDGVVLHALDDAGLLEPLLRAGARISIDRSVVEMIDGQMRQRSDAADLARSIEKVRSTLRAALMTCNAVTSGFRRDPEDTLGRNADLEREQAMTPLISLLQDRSGVDVLVSGDRMVNRHGLFTDRDGGSRHVLTVIDVINQLVRSGSITDGRRSLAIRKLREAGVAMIPVSPDEITAAAGAGNWTNGPPRSLRAIVDSILLPLLRRAPLLPDDRHWLRVSILAMAIAIRKCWTLLEPDIATKAADFLFLNMPNIAGWIERDPDPGAAAWAEEVTTAGHALLGIGFEIPTERLEAYHDWYESRVRPRLEGRDASALPGLRSRLSLVLTGRHAAPDEAQSPSTAPIQQSRLNLLIASLIPEFHREALVAEAAVQEALGGTPAAIIVDGYEVAIVEIGRFLAATIDAEVVPLVALDGTLLADRGFPTTDGAVAINRPWGRLRFDVAGLFGSDPAIRMNTFDGLTQRNTLAPSSAARWRLMISSQSLPADLMAILMDELQATPQGFIAAIRDIDRSLSFSDISRLDERLLASILDVQDVNADLVDTIAAVTAAHAAAPGLASGARALAPLAVSPDFSLPRLVAALDDEAVAVLCLELVEDGDAFGLLAAFEACCARPDSSDCIKAGDDVVEALLGDAARTDRITHDWCISARMVLASADLSNSLRGWPLAQRRCTLLAHAGTVARSLAEFEFNRPELLTAANGWLSTRYRLRGYVERQVSSDWVRDWLNPLVLKAELIRRMHSTIAGMDEKLRPAGWVEAIGEAVQRLKLEHLSPTFAIAGPMDAFSSRAGEREIIESSIWVAKIANADPVEGLNILYVLIAAGALPDDDLPMAVAVAGLIDRCGHDHREQAVQLALVAAAKWKSTVLAERVMDLILSVPDARGAGIAATAEFVVAAAAAQSDADTMMAWAIARLTDLAFGTLEPGGAHTLANFIDLLSNVCPDWAIPLERLRVAALLAG